MATIPSQRQEPVERLDPGGGRWRAVFEHSLDGILLLDDQRRYVEANPAACRILGYSRDALVGMNLLDVLPEQSHAAAEQAWEAFLACGVLEGEITLVRKDGQTLTVDHRTVANAMPGLHLSVVHDTTKRKPAHEHLQEVEARLRQLVENVDGYFWLTSADYGQLYYLSPSYERICGQPCETLYQDPSHWTDVVHPDDLERVVAAIGQPMGNETLQIEYRIVRPDGEVRWIHDRAFAVRDASGNVCRVAGIGEDKTSAKQDETNLRDYYERIRDLARRLITVQEDERRHLARELHDEIGQGMMALKINLQLLERSDDRRESSALLQETMRLADDTLEQVRSIALRVRPSTLDDLGLVAATRGYLDRQASRTGLAIRLTADDRLDRLPSDVETACFRVVQEAMTNVIRHAGASRVEVELHMTDHTLRLLVSDNGTGFDPVAARQRAVEGHSLGLLSIEERVKPLGGEVEIRSTRSSGTRLAVTLPIAKGPPVK